MRCNYARAKNFVGDRDPRGHEFSIQLRAMYNDRSGAGLGLPVMITPRRTGRREAGQGAANARLGSLRAQRLTL